MGSGLGLYAQRDPDKIFTSFITHAPNPGKKVLGQTPILAQQFTPPPPVIADFSIPDTVCVNSAVAITNHSVNASTYFWNFCSANLTVASPVGTNLGNISGALSQPVFMDFAFDGTNYYGFVMNHHPGGLIRLDFGNSLLNMPVAVNLGNFGGIIPTEYGSEGIQIVQNNDKWYAIIVGGHANQASKPRILKVDFGADLANPTPTATNWGNLGNMNQPIDLHVFNQSGNWYGFTVNAENNTIVRFNFTDNFDNTPTAVNLGSIGGIAYPTGIYAVNDDGYWRVFITNCGDNSGTSSNSSLTRLDFGNSLLNTPIATNIGNPGNVLRQPRDITIVNSCGETIAFIVNGEEGVNDIVRLNFDNDLTTPPQAASLGNTGNLRFPHSISKLFRVKENIYGFVTNVTDNTLTRIQYSGCADPSLPSSFDAEPGSIVYNQPGTYSINLTIDDGLPTQTSICKQVVVLPQADFSFTQEICMPLTAEFRATPADILNARWRFGDGNTAVASSEITHTYSGTGTYLVELEGDNACAMSKTIGIDITDEAVILTPDTTICEGTSGKLRTSPGVLDACWSPATYLDDPRSPNPITHTPHNITYYLNASVTKENLITNGDFSAGNSGFTSAYTYNPDGIPEGQYFIGVNPNQWNSALSGCGDHTSGSGNMMMVNGSATEGLTVWSTTLTVAPHTNYAFSTWIQSISGANPALLQFSINDNPLGSLIQAPATTCNWSQFYTLWNSGTHTTITISIINKNTVANGNDFALDDISFAPLHTVRDSITVYVEKPAVVATPDTTVCPGSAVPLHASGAQTYSWSPATGLDGSDTPAPVATVLQTTAYIVTGISARGCSANDTVEVTVLPAPSVTLSRDTIVCRNSPAQLEASGGISYRWHPAAGLDNPYIANPVARSDSNIVYTVTVTDANQCTNEDSVAVNVFPYPTFTVSADRAICRGSSVTLQATGGDLFQWSPDFSLDDPFSAAPTATPQATTIYTVNIAESTCQFDTVLYTTVTVNPLPAIVIDKSNDVNCNTPTALLSASGALSYSWAPSHSLKDPSTASPLASPDTTTTFMVTGINEHGCTSTSSITVKVDQSGVPRFVVPNAFTPNGDGRNDCFGIQRWGNTIVEQFSVYNRWGQLVFQSKDPGQCWDGSFAGKPQAGGVYIYIIKAKTLCGEVLRKGTLTLIR